MKANLIITKSDGMPMAILNAEVESVLAYTTTINAKILLKEDLNELVKLGAGMTFFEDYTHLCIPRKVVKSIEFV